MFKKQGIHILESNLAICNRSFKNDPPHRTTGEAQASTTAVVHHIVAEGKVRWEPLDSFFYVFYTLETKRRPKVTSRPNTALCPSCVAHEAALEQSCAHLFMCLLSMAASRPQQPGEQASRCMWRSLLFATTNCPDTVKTWKCFKCHQYCLLTVWGGWNHWHSCLLIWQVIFYFSWGFWYVVSPEDTSRVEESWDSMDYTHWAPHDHLEKFQVYF